MTDTERRFLVEKYGKLLQDVLVEIRNLSYQEGNAKRINDLADLTHNIPEFLVGWNDHVLGYLRLRVCGVRPEVLPRNRPREEPVCDAARHGRGDV